MPNHVHAIVVLGGAYDPDAAHSESSSVGQTRQGTGLGEVVRTLKAASTRLIRLAGFPDFAWQPNYFERVIRSDQALHRVRGYIAGNPSRWEEDELYRA
jgi:putative transposase